MPAVSRFVGRWVAEAATKSFEGWWMGDAWVMAMRQASASIVRGEGEGNGEDGPERRIVLLRGVFNGLGVPFSSCVGSLRKVGVRKIGLGCPAFRMLPLSLASLLDRGLTPSMITPSRLPSLSVPSPPVPRRRSRNRWLPCCSRSYHIHCMTRQRSTKT